MYGATLEVASPSSVGGEKHHIVAQVSPEQLGQVTQVVVVAGEVTAIFVLHLRVRKSELFPSGVSVLCCDVAGRGLPESPAQR